MRDSERRSNKQSPILHGMKVLVSKVMKFLATGFLLLVIAVVMKITGLNPDAEEQREVPVREVPVREAVVDPQLKKEEWFNTLMDNAHRLSELGLNEKAIEEFDEALDYCSTDSNRAEVFLGRGRAFMELDNDDNAMRDFTKCIQIEPVESTMNELGIAWSTLALENRAFIYREKGKLEKSLKDYTEAIKIDPSESAIYVGRGYVYHLKASPEMALSDYNKAIDLGGISDSQSSVRWS